ncbi:receptor expression-enhancing protein 4 isoform X2 [Tribolium castaneum]
MMYWIVFALFTCAETFTDVFFSWLPFYYEIKIILVIWLLSPATKGSSILYRKFVHPALSSREQEIDEYISKAKEQSYKQFLDLGSKGVTALMQTALKGGGGLVNQLRKSYSLSDLSDPSQDMGDGTSEVVITDPRLLRRRRSPSRASTTSLYFQEVDVVRSDRIQHVQSAEDISSGYSSGEGLYVGQPPKLQPREGLTRTGSLTRTRPTRVTRSTGLKKSSLSEESDDSEIFDTNIIFLNDKARSIHDLANESSEEEFFDSLHDESVVACDLDQDRKGKYHKRAAPQPPTIKATLVLKPGVVKPLECKEVFIQSPKPKRRTIINKGRLDSSLSKLINFPKKIKHSFERMQSRSDNDLRSVGKSDRLSIQSLTESPMARRRLKIIRTFVDEDIH